MGLCPPPTGAHPEAMGGRQDCYARRVGTLRVVGQRRRAVVPTLAVCCSNVTTVAYNPCGTLDRRYAPSVSSHPVVSGPHHHRRATPRASGRLTRFDVGCDVRCLPSASDVPREDKPIRRSPRVARRLRSDASLQILTSEFRRQRPPIGSPPSVPPRPAAPSAAPPPAGPASAPGPPCGRMLDIAPAALLRRRR